MPPRLAALESSGADSSGLTEAVMELSAALMFGSRNGMSLCGRSESPLRTGNQERLPPINADEQGSGTPTTEARRHGE
jgi:hypothetical protein